MSNFTTNEQWSLKPEAQKLEVQVFFRGLGGNQDTILTLAKLQEAGVYIYHYAMLDGVKFVDMEKRIGDGEATLGFTTFFMPDTDFIKKLYAILFDFNQNKNIDKKHWLNDYDQYMKIQVKHRVDGGDWSEWTDDE